VNFAVGFIPYEGARTPAKLPNPPIEVWANIKGEGSEVSIRLTDHQSMGVVKGDSLSLTHQGSGFFIPPGAYQISSFTAAIHPDLSPTRTIPLLTQGIKFVVLPSFCVYIGEIFVSYYRLPAGSPGDAAAMVQELFMKKTGRTEGYYVFLNTGSLVPESGGLSRQPTYGGSPPGSEICAERPAEWVQ
jgi:hypothetical protein